MPRHSGPYDAGKDAARRALETEAAKEAAKEEPSSQPHPLETDRLAWERFLRTLKPNSVRQPRVEKMPEHLAADMISMAGKKRWFRLWLENGSTWKDLAEKVGRECPAQDSAGVPEWRTLEELTDHYKSKELAETIAQSKRVLGRFRAHPSTPTDLDKVQFQVVLEKVS